LPVYSYLNLGEGIPAAPIFPIVVTPPDWVESIAQYPIDGFLDTGSDCTLVPLEVLSVLDLKILDRPITIAGVGGSRFQGFPCYLNIAIGDKSIQAIRAYGCSWDGLQQRVLIGRDVINRCYIELDGGKSTIAINPLVD
jgi:hypothetical protein